jgi:hypothetical protein
MNDDSKQMLNVGSNISSWDSLISLPFSIVPEILEQLKPSQSYRPAFQQTTT